MRKQNENDVIASSQKKAARVREREKEKSLDNICGKTTTEKFSRESHTRQKRNTYIPKYIKINV